MSEKTVSHTTDTTTTDLAKIRIAGLVVHKTFNPRIIPALEELRGQQLVQRRRAKVQRLLQNRHLLDDRLVGQDEPQAQARRQGLRESEQRDHVGLTEHVRDDANRIVVIVNYSPQAIRENLTLTDGWHLNRVLHGKARRNGPTITVDLGKNDGCVLSLSTK